MQGHLMTVDGKSVEATTDEIEGLLSSSTRFWLDLEGLDESGERLLRETFGFHELAVEDADHFGQRPKIDSYGDYALIVVYGVTPDGALVEVHCFYTGEYLVTVHHDPCPNLDGLRDRFARRPTNGQKPDHVMLLYRVVDMLVDSYFPVLALLDDRIDELEDEILQAPTDQQLGKLFDMKRSLIAMRKVVTPQRDMFATLLSGSDALPGMTPEAERYFRDLYDHLIRISDLLDSYRDLMSGAMDTHLSTVSNRLNVVMKQLTIIATIFLPLSFLTGFFGQNFGWMINRITSLPVFLLLGVGLQLAVAVGLYVLFRQRGWLTPSGMVPAGTPSSRPRLGAERRWRLVRPEPHRAGAAGGPKGS